MEVEGIEFREALKILAKEAGIELTSSEFKRSSEESDVYRLYKSAAEFYHRALFESENIEKLAYLQNRGLSQETIEKFQLGYSGEPRALMEHLKSTGTTEQQIIDSGLFVSAYRDKFFGRITFPIANFLGHIVAFTARIINEGEPKYLNSPASAIFDKSKTLYGFHLAKTEISRKKYAIIVEGQMDTVALHQA
jgi:DNA primase